MNNSEEKSTVGTYVGTVYSCAGCGVDVKLKKTDDVKCHVCGYRILYKKRNPEADSASRTYECV
jgi:DNA-directed RNA polymerase subunit RPC12/RpoP